MSDPGTAAVRKPAALRLAVRRYLETGEQAALDALLPLARQEASPRVTLYEAFSLLLSGAPKMRAFRLLSLRQQLDITLDPVDGAVLAFCLGDLPAALEAIHAAPVTGPERRRVLLWRAFLVGKAALDAGVHAGEAPLPVFQFWDTTPPADVAAAMDLWRDVAGEHYARFDEASARDLLAACDVPGVIEAYDRAWHPAMKCDIFRLGRLLLGGGLYVDADMRPAAGAPALLRAASRRLHLTFYAHMPSGRVQNSVMLAAAGHPLLRAALDVCIHNVLRADVRVPSQATGPAVLTNCLADLLAAGQVPATLMSYTECQRRLATDFRPGYKTSEKSWQVAVGRA